MKTLVILAHPDLEKSIANKYIKKQLEASKLNIKIRDIYNLYPNYTINKKAEQEALLNTDNIILQYPFYWYSVPAILKLWLDVVLDFNFAYGPKGYKLQNKNFLLNFTIGASADAYSPLGSHHFRIEELIKPIEQMAYFIKVNYLPPVYQYSMTHVPKVYENKDIVEKNAEKQVQMLFNVINKLEKEQEKNR